MPTELRELDEDLWVTEAPLRFMGLEVGARMSVIRLASGELFLHSPVEPSPELRGALDALGRVKFLVCPNRLHHLFAGAVRDAYPASEIHVAPGLETKRQDLDIADVLHDVPDARWAEAIDQHLVRGAPFVNEVVFLHRPTRTLLLTDLAFNFGPSAPAWTRLAMRWMGAKEFGPSYAERFLAIRDRAAARRSFEQLLRWDFDRVIVSHGDVLESGGPARLREAYGWLLGASPA